jgi:hypothetical protein
MISLTCSIFVIYRVTFIGACAYSPFLLARVTTLLTYAPQTLTQSQSNAADALVPKISGAPCLSITEY